MGMMTSKYMQENLEIAYDLLRKRGTIYHKTNEELKELIDKCLYKYWREKRKNGLFYDVYMRVADRCAQVLLLRQKTWEKKKKV